MKIKARDGGGGDGKWGVNELCILGRRGSAKQKDTATGTEMQQFY